MDFSLRRNYEREITPPNGMTYVFVLGHSNRVRVIDVKYRTCGTIPIASAICRGVNLTKTVGKTRIRNRVSCTVGGCVRGFKETIRTLKTHAICRSAHRY